MKKKELAIIIILLVIEIISLFLMYKSGNNREQLVFNIKSTEEIKYNNLAIMLEKTDGTGYVESTMNKWPTNMEFNETLSGCVDENENKIEGALKYKDGVVEINTTKSCYCYLYFDNIPPRTFCVKGDIIGTCLLEFNSTITSLNDNLEGGLYRYQGTKDVVNDNYICFGTSNKNECINNPDKYMYRIIGIQNAGPLKLLKYRPLETKYYYHEVCRPKNINTSLENTSIFKYLNNEGFLNNREYVPNNWENLIINSIWKYDTLRVEGYYMTAEYMYNKYINYQHYTNGKIGLMYLHDYFYGMPGGVNCETEREICKESWMPLYKNDFYADLEYEWLIEQYGWWVRYDLGSYEAATLSVDGYTSGSDLDIKHYIRPVFILSNMAKYNSGIGKINDPFIIEEP